MSNTPTPDPSVLAAGHRPTLTWESLKITPQQQQAKAMLASRLATGANLLLELGEIDRERHTEIIRMLAPDLKPVINALNRTILQGDKSNG